jgi:Pol polyprotein, beta-barrel domain/gag-polypeptide of LTR copia-type
MSTTTLTTTDLLPSSVPKLMANGLNWTAFSMRFRDAVEAKGLWGYFDGTTPQPTVSVPPTTDEEDALTKWVKEDRTAKALLTHRIPDSTLIRIHGKSSLTERWALIVKEFSTKGAFAQADLRTHFMESKCPDKSNIREFLDGLRVKREELATFGVDIEEKDYRSTIIKSLPPHLSAFASNLLAGAKLYSSTKTIGPDGLIMLVSEEYECHAAQRSRRSGHASGKGEDKDEAMFVSPNGKGKKINRKPRGTCWNCGDKGHYKNKCPKPVKQTGDKKHDSQKGGGSANVAIESDDEDEAAFFADLDDDDELPILLSNYKSDSDAEEHTDGWFSEMDDDAECIESQDNVDRSECVYPVNIYDDQAVAEAENANAVHIKDSTEAENQTHIEVYDSGCTRHITPYREAVTDFKAISPKSFQAANKQSFNAVGTGEMVIDVPNGVTTSQLRLTEVLYSPEVGYTLVSVGKLDEAGFTLSFADGKCVIQK